MESGPPSSEASTDARCASHPTRTAELTCARCGSFVCAECRSSDVEGHCAACAERLSRGRLVGHVPALGITMMVNGVLTAGMGIYYVVFGGFFAHSFLRSEARPGAEPHPLDELFPGMVFGAFGVLALVHALPGALQIWAGYRVRVFRSRTLGWVALSAGLVTIFGCYCAFTALPLFVWGLVALRDETVAARFAAEARER